MALGPGRAGDDRRLAGSRVEYGLGELRRRGARLGVPGYARRASPADRGRGDTGRARTARGAGDEVQRHVIDRLRAAQLDHVGGSDPDRLAEGVRRAGVRVGVVSGDRGQRPPAPLAATRAGPQLDPDAIAAARPLHPGEGESRRRVDHAGLTVEPPDPAAEHTIGGS